MAYSFRHTHTLFVNEMQLFLSMIVFYSEFDAVHVNSTEWGMQPLGGLLISVEIMSFWRRIIQQILFIRNHSINFL